MKSSASKITGSGRDTRAPDCHVPTPITPPRSIEQRSASGTAMFSGKVGAVTVEFLR